MKFFLFTLFLAGSLVGFGQRFMFGLYSPYYSDVRTEKRVNKSISIIYNDRYCKFSVGGQAVAFFTSLNYSRSIEKDGLHTDFISDETDYTPMGYYQVIIVENKKGISYQVAVRNGSTYYVGNAKKYNENGEVHGRISMDYDATIREMNKNDSLNKVDIAKSLLIAQNKKTEDSLWVVNRDSLTNISKITQLNTGDNYNSVDIKWMQDVVVKKLKINKYCYGDIKVHIDSKGTVTSASILSHIQGGEYIEQISSALVGLQTTPWHLLGKPYPSYAIFYVSLEPTKN